MITGSAIGSKVFDSRIALVGSIVPCQATARITVVPEIIARFGKCITHTVIAVLPLGSQRCIFLELRILHTVYVDRKSVLTKVHIGKLTAHPYHINQIGLCDILADGSQRLVIATCKDILFVGTLLYTCRIGFCIFQNKHILLRLFFQSIRLKQTECLAVDNLFGRFCRNVQQLTSPFFISAKLLPSSFVKSHTGEKRPTPLTADTSSVIRSQFGKTR